MTQRMNEGYKGCEALKVVLSNIGYEGRKDTGTQWISVQMVWTHGENG